MKPSEVLVLIAATVAFAAPVRLVAQFPDARPLSISSRCLDTTSTVPSVASIVYVQASVADSIARPAAQMADIFAQSVAQRLRVLLHARGDTLPPGEPAVTWRGVSDGTPLIVKMVRDSQPVFTSVAPHADSLAGAMLVNAAHVAVDSGEAPFWPQGMGGDTLVFGIGYLLSPPGRVRPEDPHRAVFPVFSVMFPPFTPAKQIGISFPRYPPDLQSTGITGVVISRFVVDTAGRPIPASIKAIGNASQNSTGDAFAGYDEFAKSVFKWIRTLKLTPARLGGCAVPEVVTKPTTFSISH